MNSTLTELNLLLQKNQVLKYSKYLLFCTAKQKKSCMISVLGKTMCPGHVPVSCGLKQRK